MSTNLICYVQTNKKIEAFGEIIASVNGVALDSSRYPPRLYVSSDSISIGINLFGGILQNKTTVTEDIQKWLQNYGFIPDIEVDFLSDAGNDPIESLNSIGRSVAKILKTNDGNVVFIFDSGITILERINGQIFLTDETKFCFNGYKWLGNQLTKNHLKFQEKTLDYKGI